MMRRLLLLLLSSLTSCCCYCSMPFQRNRWGPPILATTKSTTTSSTTSSTTTTTTALHATQSSSSSAAAASSSKTEPWSTTASSSSSSSSSSVTTRDVLSLESIRSSLIRQEETIIFALIERAQFRQNSIVYQKGGFGNLGLPIGCISNNNNNNNNHQEQHQQQEGFAADNNNNDDNDDDNIAANNDTDEEQLSFLEYMLLGTEVLHSRVRRYTSPEEHAFFPERLPGSLPALKQLDYPQDLLSSSGNANQINFNPLLLQYYMAKVVPSLCRHYNQGDDDDEQHGSTVLCDIAALQALSRRIHYGKFVAESKYQSNPDAYQTLIDDNNDAAVMALLTDPVVERKVLLRARLKATTYGREPLVLSNFLSNDVMDTYYHHDGNNNKKSSASSSEQQYKAVEDETGSEDLTALIAATAAASAVVAALDALPKPNQHHSRYQQQQQQQQINGDDDNALPSTAAAAAAISSPLSKGKGSQNRPKVDPMVIEEIYRDIIIPLTKDVEVAYLFRRCGREPPAQYNVIERMKQQWQTNAN